MTTPIRTRRGPEEGAVALEFALTISLLLLMVLGIIQFALAIWQGHAMLQAISYAGRYVMVSYASGNTPCDASCAQSRINAVAPNATASASIKSSSDPDCPGPNQMELSASYTTSLALFSVPVAPKICVPLL